MIWEKIELHVEHLVPGLVVGGVIVAHVELPVFRTQVPDLAMVAIMIAAAYVMGTLGNVMSRLAVNPMSKLTLRRLFLNWFGRLRKERWKWSEWDDEFSTVIDYGLSCGNKHIEIETVKHRTTLRIVRSSLVPVCTLICFRGFDSDWTPLGMMMLIAMSYAMILALYAYSEVGLYREGRRGQRVIDNKKAG